jgi:hypothetical protein
MPPTWPFMISESAPPTGHVSANMTAAPIVDIGGSKMQMCLFAYTRCSTDFTLTHGPF